ncbi:hypothetical protein [Bdellovibrio sp. HCB337]|uniref:hypothetical protein n=1 Tax=Bdellovibrio sp. HCB337 TaxID=3394358 RepID=UPI0039A51840
MKSKFLIAILVGSGIAVVIFLKSKPERVPDDLRPPATLMGAEQILKGDGWRTASQSLDPKDSGIGCIEAQLNSESGKICFLKCEGRSAQAISQEVGPSYGYQIGAMEKCASYTTFEGSAEFQKALWPQK